jgi:hypothetical protein
MTRVSLVGFSRSGVRLGAPVTFSSGSQAQLISDPVLAALPGGAYAAAWTDLNGDGDELGVALRSVNPLGPAPTTTPPHANQTTDFSQYDPDILRVGSSIVVAWVDAVDAFTGPDLKYRVFSESLVPQGDEQTLAHTPAAEADVALAPFANTWAAAWRSSSAGSDSIVITVPSTSTTWSIGPLMPGSAEDRPALAELDANHLLVVFTEGVDVGSTGLSHTPKLRGGILATGTPGTATAFSLEPPAMGPGGGAAELAQTHPNVVRVENRLYLAWRSSSTAGNANHDELWLREASWNGTALNLFTVLPLPRSTTHQPGDQRFPALAASPLGPAGAIVAAWDDYGRVFGGVEGAPDVVVELIPSPLLRLPTGGGQ